MGYSSSERASVLGCPVIITLQRILVLAQMLRIFYVFFDTEVI